jgi:hypothetical protein
MTLSIREVIEPGAERKRGKGSHLNQPLRGAGDYGGGDGDGDGGDGGGALAASK